MGVPTYDDEGKEVNWKVLVDYKPIIVDIYHEAHILKKNVMELRGPKENSPRLKSEQHRASYLNAYRVIVAGSRGFLSYYMQNSISEEECFAPVLELIDDLEKLERSGHNF